MPNTANNIPLQSFYGYSTSWAFEDGVYTISGVSLLQQTADTEMGVDQAEARDYRGTVVSTVFYNPNDKCTLEFIVANTSSFDSGTASITYPTQGMMITIGAASDDPISGSNWLVQGNLVRRSNTDYTKVQLKCIRYAGIIQ